MSTAKEIVGLSDKNVSPPGGLQKWPLNTAPNVSFIAISEILPKCRRLRMGVAGARQPCSRQLKQ